MTFDAVPIPSQGLFYEGEPEYLDVYHITTNDEIMMSQVNLFNKGDVLYRLLEKKVCEPNNIKLDSLLVNDKEFLLLYLRETAYNHIIDYQEKEETFFFDTHSILIKNLTKMPDDGQYFTYKYSDTHIFKLKLLTIGDEKVLKKTKRNKKIDFYIAHIFSLNGREDRGYIESFIKHLPILEGRKIKKYIDGINFGVVKDTQCIVNGKPVKTTVTMDESFFGYNLDSLSKINKSLNDSVIFLTNEGQGYMQNDVLFMPTHVRKYHEEKLIEKITRMNDQLNKK